MPRTTVLLAAVLVAAAPGCGKSSPATPTASLQPAAPTPPPAAPAQASPAPPAAPALPPDEQVQRDAFDYTAKWLTGMDERAQPFKVVSKDIDKFERDECNTVAERRIQGGGRWRVFATYYRKADFWKLRTINSRIF